MTTPRYLSVAEFRTWAHDDTAADVTVVEEAINAAEEWLDFESKRELVLVDGDTVATSRSFRPRWGDDVLWIGDAASITSVVENGVTLVDGTDYQAEPFNNKDSQGAYRPFCLLRRLDQCWYTNGPRATVTVTAKWGWSTIPPAVKEACKFLTQDWLANRDIRGNVVGVTAEGFSIGVRENPNVVKALQVVKHPLSYGI